jgi:hypothetical protein
MITVTPRQLAYHIDETYQVASLLVADAAGMIRLIKDLCMIYGLKYDRVKAVFENDIGILLM